MPYYDENTANQYKYHTSTNYEYENIVISETNDGKTKYCHYTTSEPYNDRYAVQALTMARSSYHSNTTLQISMPHYKNNNNIDTSN